MNVKSLDTEIKGEGLVLDSKGYVKASSDVPDTNFHWCLVTGTCKKCNQVHNESKTIIITSKGVPVKSITESGYARCIKCYSPLEQGFKILN